MDCVKIDDYIRERGIQICTCTYEAHGDCTGQSLADVYVCVADGHVRCAEPANARAILSDGRSVDRLHLYAAAIELDSTHKLAWLGVWNCVRERAISSFKLSKMPVPSGIPARSWMDAAKRTVMLLRNRGHDFHRSRLDDYLAAYHHISDYAYMHPGEFTWTRQMHACGMWQDAMDVVETDLMFATLLQGIQRLETTGVLAPSHHSMLEDMLECWTWRDHLDIWRLR